MNDPKRWLEPGSDAPEGATELLRSARPARPIDKATLSVSAAAAAKLAVTPAAAAALPFAAKLAISACAAAAVGVVAVRTVAPPSVPPTPAHHVAHEHASARVAHPGASRVAAHEAMPPLAAKPEEPVPAPVLTESPTEQAAPHKAVEHLAGKPRAALRSSEPVTPAPPPLDALAAEVASLDAARALLQSDPKRALALASEHAALAPNATLAPERELIAIDALRRLGRRSEARARAAALLARYPGSIYQQRLESMLP